MLPVPFLTLGSSQRAGARFGDCNQIGNAGEDCLGHEATAKKAPLPAAPPAEAVP